jgi:hypothetical protein
MGGRRRRTHPIDWVLLGVVVLVFVGAFAGAVYAFVTQ